MRREIEIKGVTTQGEGRINDPSISKEIIQLEITDNMDQTFIRLDQDLFEEKSQELNLNSLLLIKKTNLNC